LGVGMRPAMPAGASKSVAVTVIGLLTLLCGGGYVALGADFILGGAGWFLHPDPELVRVQPEPDMGIILGAWLTLGAAVLVVVGILLVLLGLLVLLAALGVLWRKQWGRILTYVVAVLAILLGLLCLSGVYGAQDVVQVTTVLALGVPQVLYGILALVILSIRRADFSGSRV
jgi:hypothetical protein